MVVQPGEAYYRYLRVALTTGDVSDDVLNAKTTILHRCLAPAVSPKEFNIEALYGFAHKPHIMLARDSWASQDLVKGSAYGALGVLKGPEAFEKSLRLHETELAGNDKDQLANNNYGTILGWYARGLFEDGDKSWVGRSRKALEHLYVALDLREKEGVDQWDRDLTRFNVATNSLFFALHTGDEDCARNAVDRFSQLTAIVDEKPAPWIIQAVGHHLEDDLRVANALLSAIEEAGPEDGELGYRKCLKFDSGLKNHYEVKLFRYKAEGIDSIADGVGADEEGALVARFDEARDALENGRSLTIKKVSNAVREEQARPHRDEAGRTAFCDRVNPDMARAHLSFRVVDEITDKRSGEVRREERFGDSLRVTSTGQLEIRMGTNGRSLTTSRQRGAAVSGDCPGGGSPRFAARGDASRG